MSHDAQNPNALALGVCQCVLPLLPPPSDTSRKRTMKAKPDFWLTTEGGSHPFPEEVKRTIARVLPECGRTEYPAWRILYLDLGMGEYELTIYECEKGRATSLKSFRYLATIGKYDTHLGTPYYELQDRVDNKDPDDTMTYYILSKCKSLGLAISNLLRYGTLTKNGRKSIGII